MWNPSGSMDLEKIPPALGDAAFLYRVAIAKGHPKAQAGLDAIKREQSAVEEIKIPEIKSKKKSAMKGFEPFMEFPGLE